MKSRDKNRKTNINLWVVLIAGLVLLLVSGCVTDQEAYHAELTAIANGEPYRPEGGTTEVISATVTPTPAPTLSPTPEPSCDELWREWFQRYGIKTPALRNSNSGDVFTKPNVHISGQFIKDVDEWKAYIGDELIAEGDGYDFSFIGDFDDGKTTVILRAKASAEATEEMQTRCGYPDVIVKEAEIPLEITVDLQDPILTDAWSGQVGSSLIIGGYVSDGNNAIRNMEVVIDLAMEPQPRAKVNPETGYFEVSTDLQSVIDQVGVNGSVPLVLEDDAGRTSPYQVLLPRPATMWVAYDADQWNSNGILVEVKRIPTPGYNPFDVEQVGFSQVFWGYDELVWQLFVATENGESVARCEPSRDDPFFRLFGILGWADIRLILGSLLGTALVVLLGIPLIKFIRGMGNALKRGTDAAETFAGSLQLQAHHYAQTQKLELPKTTAQMGPQAGTLTRSLPLAVQRKVKKAMQLRPDLPESVIVLYYQRGQLDRFITQEKQRQQRR